MATKAKTTVSKSTATEGNNMSEVQETAPTLDWEALAAGATYGGELPKRTRKSKPVNPMIVKMLEASYKADSEPVTLPPFVADEKVTKDAENAIRRAAASLDYGVTVRWASQPDGKLVVTFAARVRQTRPRKAKTE